MDKIIEILKEQHGGKLSFDNYQSHYLFLKDGLVTVYLDQETKTLKVEVEQLEENQVFIYHSERSLAELIS